MIGSQIKTELTRIIDSLIIYNYPVLDDDQPDLLSDGEKRQEAIDQLKDMLELHREEL